MPAHSKAANDLLKSFDLGIEGAFIPFNKKLVATLDENVTQDQLDRQPAEIKSAFEQAGCVNVIVITDNAN